MTSAQHDPASPTAIGGLGEAEALQRLKTEGPNELPQPDRRTPLRIAIEVLREPMLALLLVGGMIYLVLGDLKEAIILLAFATMSILITVVQETRTERVLEALRDLTSSPRAGHSRRRSVDALPAATSCAATSSSLPRVTASLPMPSCLQAHDLQTDESLLTGESVPVRKIARGAHAAHRLAGRAATTCLMCFPARSLSAVRDWPR